MPREKKNTDESSAPEVEVKYERCAGIDVHKKQITVCLVVGDKKEIREYGTMTGDLLDCIAWLEEEQCEIVLMESTSVYWKPVYNLFEVSDVQVRVANAYSVKQISGRRTDVQSSEWLATLLRFGLVKYSLIPSRDQRELREMVRYRNTMIRERASEVNRVHKILEGANIKLSSIVTDMQGTTAISILRLLSSGEVDPIILSMEAKGALRNKVPELQKALEGNVGPHQQKMLQLQIQHYDHMTKMIEELDEEIKKKLVNEEETITLLCTIPGIGERSAQKIVAEIGTDMSRFPSSDHIASWAGLAPGINESAGKRKPALALPGNEHLRTTLVEAAWSSIKGKGIFFRQRYWRLVPRCGKKKAIVAVARSMLVAIYHMIKNKTSYLDRGNEPTSQKQLERSIKRSIYTLQTNGYTVIQTPTPEPAI